MHVMRAVTGTAVLAVALLALGVYAADDASDAVSVVVPVGGRASEYADFLVEGVMPFVESRYPVSLAPERTAG